MGRSATGEVKKYTRKDGTNTYSLRIRALGDRWTVPLGNEFDGWSDKRAELELANTMEKIKAGVWRPPAPLFGVDADPSFHEYASHWLAEFEPLLKPKTYNATDGCSSVISCPSSRTVGCRRYRPKLSTTTGVRRCSSVRRSTGPEPPARH